MMNNIQQAAKGGKESDNRYTFKSGTYIIWVKFVIKETNISLLLVFIGRVLSTNDRTLYAVHVQGKILICYKTIRMRIDYIYPQLANYDAESH